MLEESKMEKKSLNRSSQSQSRPGAVDCKKTETNKQPLPRHHKKRDGSCFPPKNDPNRKITQSQRGRSQVERRTKVRSNSNNLMGGATGAGLEETFQPEIGSVFEHGRKKQKQNLNYLLNFNFPSRGGAGQRDFYPHRHIQNRGSVLYKHRLDLYLKAYCQFVVKEDGNYEKYLQNPSELIQWDQIEEIIVRSNGTTECPICLEKPVAARVGCCGHVYCWPCILHYYTDRENERPPCPVCNQPLQVKLMKPARTLQWQSLPEEVTMRLVRRLKDSKIVEVAPPRGRQADKAEVILPMQYIPTAPYTRIFKANKKQVLEILNREKGELKEKLNRKDIENSEKTFVELALGDLKLKEQEFYETSQSNEYDKISDPQITSTINQPQEAVEKKIDWFDTTDETAVDIEDELEKLKITPDSCEMLEPSLEYSSESTHSDSPASSSSSTKDIDVSNQEKYIYFFQADDGQPIFLHGFNVQLLIASWGSLYEGPRTIKGRILHHDTFSITEEEKRKFTAHLPLFCSYEIVELDLKHPYVQDSVLERYNVEITKRARNRVRAESDERRRERAYRRKIEKQPQLDFTSETLFPPVPATLDDITLFPPVCESDASAQTNAPTSCANPTSSVLSFAKMAGTSGTWKERIKVPAPIIPSYAEDDEEVLTGPRVHNLNDVIEAAMHAPVLPKGHKGKKKKSKQRLLFSTGVQHTT